MATVLKQKPIALRVFCVLIFLPFITCYAEAQRLFPTIPRPRYGGAK